MNLRCGQRRLKDKALAHSAREDWARSLPTSWKKRSAPQSKGLVMVGSFQTVVRASSGDQSPACRF